MSMFADAGGDLPPPVIPSSEWSEAEMLLHEKQTLGFYITRHPLTQHEAIIKRFGTATTADVKRMATGESGGSGAKRYGRGGGRQVIVGGLISQVRNIAIRNGRSAGKKMAVIHLEDLVGSIEAIVFPDNLAEFAPLMKPDTVVFITAEVDTRREEPCLRVGKITPVERAARDLTEQVVVDVESAGGPDARIENLRKLCGKHRGRCRIYFRVSSKDGWTTTIEAGDATRVDPNSEFLSELGALVGAGNFSCIGGRGSA